jgi:hypothetical protein
LGDAKHIEIEKVLVVGHPSAILFFATFGGFDQEIPHHSTFSKNWHGRFQESKLFEQLFEQIVRQCVEAGLVQGKHLSVDGSFVEAKCVQRELYSTRATRRSRTSEPNRAPVSGGTGAAESDRATRSPARPGIDQPLTRPKAARRRVWVNYDNYLVHNDSFVIVGVQAMSRRRWLRKRC